MSIGILVYNNLVPAPAEEEGQAGCVSLSNYPDCRKRSNWPDGLYRGNKLYSSGVGREVHFNEFRAKLAKLVLNRCWMEVDRNPDPDTDFVELFNLACWDAHLDTANCRALVEDFNDHLLTVATYAPPAGEPDDTAWFIDTYLMLMGIFELAVRNNGVVVFN
jgi:hypothetical protein